MIELPRLLRDGTRLHPVSLSVTLSEAPVHTAEMEILPDEHVAPRDLVELFTPQGSAGVFRVTAVDRTWGETTSVTLQHALCTLNDSLLIGEEEKQGSARELLTTILAAQTEKLWELGKVDIPDETLITWENSNSGLLDAVSAVLEGVDGYMLTFDQARTPWLLNVVSLSDDDACECRLNRNMTSLTVSYDTEDMCTRVYIPGRDKPLDADTLNQWGVIARVLDADEDLGEEILLQEAQAFLDERKEPEISVVIDALDLSNASGEPFDSFHVGRICRVVLPEDNEVIRQRIVSVTWNDVYNDSENATVTLSQDAPDTAASIAGLVVDTTIVRKTVTDNQRKNLKIINQAYEVASSAIIMASTKVNKEDLKPVTEAVNANTTAVKNLSDEVSNHGVKQFLLESDVEVLKQTAGDANGATLMTKTVQLGGLKITPSYGTITYTPAGGGTGSFTAVTGITVTGNVSETITYLGK